MAGEDTVQAVDLEEVFGAVVEAGEAEVAAGLAEGAAEEDELGEGGRGGVFDPRQVDHDPLGLGGQRSDEEAAGFGVGEAVPLRGEQCVGGADGNVDEECGHLTDLPGVNLQGSRLLHYYSTDAAGRQKSTLQTGFIPERPERGLRP